MKGRVTYIVLTILTLTACNDNKTGTKSNMTTVETTKQTMTSGYSEVNGIKMYYEIYGQGKPLVLIHGGGSTIQTTFGRVIPLFSNDRQLICVELQAHGRTGDRILLFHLNRMQTMLLLYLKI